MSVAMIFGSFMAGSTPLGGGVVAYPVAQLILLWPTPASRDASVLVQSVGMNAAAYLLIMTKRHLLHFELIAAFTMWGSMGVLMGLSVAASADVPPSEWPDGTLPSGLANIIFGTMILCFAILYFYVSELRPLVAPARDSAAEAVAIAGGKGETQSPWLRVLAAAFAVGGGFLTANVGSGSDMSFYIFGVFVWNVLQPPQFALSEIALTASSVVVMGLLSAVTSLARALNGGFERKVLLSWGADSFIVVLGAPVGSLVLTPKATAALRRLFYVMAVVQFVNFAVMEEAFYDSRVAPFVGSRVWIILVPLLLGEVVVLVWHHRKLVRRSADATRSEDSSGHGWPNPTLL